MELWSQCHSLCYAPLRPLPGPDPRTTAVTSVSSELRAGEKLPVFFPALPPLLIFCLPLWPELVAMEISSSRSQSSQPLCLRPRMPAVTLVQHVLPALTTQGCVKRGQLHPAGLPAPSIQVVPLWIFQQLGRALGTTGSPSKPRLSPHTTRQPSAPGLLGSLSPSTRFRENDFSSLS